MAEIEFVERWLYTTLADDTTFAGTGIYSTVAPPTATYPLIVFAALGTDDVLGAGAERIFVRGEWKVVAVGRTNSYQSLVSLANRIDTLLHRATFSSSSGNVYACVRIAPFSLTEQGEQGVTYRQLGGIYRIWTKENI
jgi:hypothetical protein